MAPNTAASQSAASPKVASQYLPSLDQDAKRAELMEDIFLATNRAGARSKLHGGIRPRGMRAYKYIDEHLTPGKVKPKPPAFSRELEEPKDQVKREIAESIGMILPRNFCPDCGKTDKPHSRGVININRYDTDRPDLHIKANSILISFFCQDCVESSTKKPNASDELLLATSQGTHSSGDMKAAERLVRIKQHTEHYIRSRILAGETSIFPQGDPYAS